MARGRGLYLKIAEADNLRLAFKKATRGKSDKPDVIEYRCNLDENLSHLRNMLLSGEIESGPYYFFTVRDPKERIISAAPFQDRVLHHAVMNICEPVFEAYAIHDSYACRTGKGLHLALKRAQGFSRHYAWYLKLDIRKYFDSIHHDTLKTLLAKRFCDKRLLELFADVIASYETAPGRGLPIGNLLSQHFANFYLGNMDHWLKEARGIGGYLRYMDDFLLFGNDRMALKAELRALEEYTDRTLQLHIKDNRQLNRSCLGIPFLGFRIFPHTVRLLPRSRKRFADKLWQFEQETLAGCMTEAQLVRKVTSIVSFTTSAEAAGFRRAVLQRQRVWSGRALTASIGAEAGTMMRRTNGRLIATTTPRTIATTT
jgi:retron-type reverse transcriptase